MKLREKLFLIFRKFESALTRVEDQGVRVENGVDTIKELAIKLNDAVDTLRRDVVERQRRTDTEITMLKNRLGTIEKQLEQPPKHH